jgi:hypothetical protein
LARKKKSSKKERSRKETSQEASAAPEAAGAAQVESPAAGPEVDAAPPVTAAATPPEPTARIPEPPKPPTSSSPGAVLLEDEPVPLDLDADLDDDGDTADAAARLIAETLATSGDSHDVAEEEEPAIDLDEDAPRTLPASAPATAPSAPPTEAPPHPLPALAAPTAEREAEPAAADAEPDEDAIDLGPVSSPEVRDRLLAAALAHSEHKDARYRVPSPDRTSTIRWKVLLIAVLLLLAGALALAPPAWVRPEPPAALNTADRLRYLRIALLLQAEQVEAFRVRSQRLPATLDELPSRLPGVRYVRSGNRAYQLIVYETDGNAVVYDSASPAPPFWALADGWVLRAGRP